jgi:hypothetical protein
LRDVAFVVSARVMPLSVRVAAALAAAALGCVVLHACANSILRNAAEAGVETVLEGPLPTPTVTLKER